MIYDMQKTAKSRRFHKLLAISPVLSIKRKKFLAIAGKLMNILFSSISSKRTKQLVYVNTNLQKILKGGKFYQDKFRGLKGANSFPLR